MCWFNDCRELRTKYKELRDVNYELESKLKKVTRTRDDLALMCEGLRKLVSMPEVAQWIDKDHALPKDGQRVNVLAYMGQYGYKERTIADYCACKGFTHPFESLYPAYRTMQVMYWSPIPEMIEEITEEMKGMR